MPKKTIRIQLPTLRYYILAVTIFVRKTFINDGRYCYLNSQNTRTPERASSSRYRSILSYSPDPHLYGSIRDTI